MHCTARNCNPKHSNELHCPALHCTLLHCTALHCTAHCRTLHSQHACSCLRKSPALCSSLDTGLKVIRLSLGVITAFIVAFHIFLVWLSCGSLLKSKQFACPIGLNLGIPCSVYLSLPSVSQRGWKTAWPMHWPSSVSSVSVCCMEDTLIHDRQCDSAI